MGVWRTLQRMWWKTPSFVVIMTNDNFGTKIFMLLQISISTPYHKSNYFKLYSKSRMVVTYRKHKYFDYVIVVSYLNSKRLIFLLISYVPLLIGLILVRII